MGIITPSIHCPQGHFMKKTTPSRMKKPKDTSKNLEEVSRMGITVNSMKPRMVESDTNGRKTQREFIHDRRDGVYPDWLPYKPPHRTLRIHV